MTTGPTSNDVKIAEIQSRHERWMAAIQGFFLVLFAAALWLPLDRIRATFASFVGEETTVTLNWPVAVFSVGLSAGLTWRLIVLHLRVNEQRRRIARLEGDLATRDKRIEELEQEAS